MVKFSKRWTIDEAYRRLTSSVEREILTSGNLPQLQRACIREIKALDSNLPNKLIPQIQVTSTVNGLLDTLTNSEYWNWFDTRLLTAVTQASGSPEAIKSLEKYKAIYYSRKVSDLILCKYKIKPFKNFVPLVEKYKKDPSKLTILDLQKHQYKIEKVVQGGLVLIEIKTGCVELTWQIPQELVYQAYTSMKRKHDELSSLAVKSLVCKGADEFAGLPILWRGQEVGEVGPIEPLPEHVRQEPYSLPQGFHWVTLTSNNIEEVVKLTSKLDAEMLSTSDYHKFSTQMINYYFTHPCTRSEWQFGIQTTNGKLVGFILGIPKHIHIKKEEKAFIQILFDSHEKYMYKRLRYILIKEFVRRANLAKINQLMIGHGSFFKPATTIMRWIYQFNHPTNRQLPSSPRTPGWRRMTSEDVPSALALINKWSSQFEIRQIFNSEEEFAHYFLLQKFVFTYIVEDKPDSITDLVSYRLVDVPHYMMNILINTVVSTQSPVKQLITDALVCARENGVSVAGIAQFNVESDILTSLSFQPSDHYTFHFYNYKCHEISQAKFGVFHF